MYIIYMYIYIYLMCDHCMNRDIVYMKLNVESAWNSHLPFMTGQDNQ